MKGTVGAVFQEFLKAKNWKEQAEKRLLPSQLKEDGTKKGEVEVEVTIVLTDDKSVPIEPVKKWIGIGKNSAEATTNVRKQILQGFPQLWEAFTQELLRTELFIQGAKIPVGENAFNEFKGAPNADDVMTSDAAKAYFIGKDGVGKYVCAFLNHRVSLLPSTMYLGVNDGGNIQGIEVTDREKDGINQLWDTNVLKHFDPEVDRSTVSLQWKRVARKDETADASKDLYVIVIQVSPDPQRRVFWFKDDCFYRKESSTTKMPPELIRGRLHDRLMTKIETIK